MSYAVAIKAPYAQHDDVGGHLPDVSPIRLQDGVIVFARGLQVGALFVRAAFAGEIAYDESNSRTVDLTGTWVVDVPGANIGLTGTDDFSFALFVADECSRFAREPLEGAQSGGEIVHRLGPELTKWIDVVCTARLRGDEAGQRVGFREWLRPSREED